MSRTPRVPVSSSMVDAPGSAFVDRSCASFRRIERRRVVRLALVAIARKCAMVAVDGRYRSHGVPEMQVFFEVGRRIGWRIRAKKRRHRLAARKHVTREQVRGRRRRDARD